MNREIIGTIKITENKITLTKNDIKEVYVKRSVISGKNWIVFRGDIWLPEGQIVEEIFEESDED